ncbi:N-acetylneuraminate lyase [Halalkalibacter oceani]|uniref:N-acetylneuraminate lyase n=1 Tax=Halalkalibacter oceani TaxID=1653776 RepID=UPI00339A7867
MNHFDGVIPALVTPFTREGKINDRVLRQIIEMNLEKGVTGFYVGGSTGEALLLSQEERKYIVDIVSDETRGKAKLIAQIGSFATKHAIELAEHAEKAGVEAISSVPPFYYQFKQDELKAYYHDLVKAVELPMILYHVPSLAGVSLTAESIRELFQGTQIVGIKHTSYDLLHLQLLLDTYPNKVIINGHDELYLASLTVGCQSSIGSTFNFMAEKFLLIDRLYKEGKIEEARSIQNEVNEVVAVLLKIGVFQGVKAALALQGIECGTCRRPFKPLTVEESELLRKVLIKNGVV